MDANQRIKKIIKKFFEKQEEYKKIILKDVNITEKFTYNRDSGSFDMTNYFVEVVLDINSYDDVKPNKNEISDEIEMTFGFECIVEFN